MAYPQDSLDELLHHLEAGQSPPREWMLAHAPHGLDALWTACTQAETLVRLYARSGVGPCVVRRSTRSWAELPGARRLLEVVARLETE